MEGHIISENKESYIWSYKRPTRRTMIKLNNLINKYYGYI